MRPPTSTDVLVVGAGPAGSAAAAWAARLGLDTVLIDAATFPRDKTCGDGLTPRAIAELDRLDLGDWVRGHTVNRGLRAAGFGQELLLPWPGGSLPDHGSAVPRTELDARIRQTALNAGALGVDGARAVDVERDEHGAVTAVLVQTAEGRHRIACRRLVVADGVRSPLGRLLGREWHRETAYGVAGRSYVKSGRGDDPWISSHLELRGEDGELLPGYGWIFALGNGRANVGLGSVSSTAKATQMDYKSLFAAWMRNAPPEWEFTPENQEGPVRGAALPMAFNRSPLYTRGLLLVGDAGGMVSPFNGEGIAYALQAGRIAADVIAQAFARTGAAARERTLATYPQRMRDDLGGYFTLGRQFVKLIEKPEVMRLCTKYGLPRPLLMKFVLKLLSDSYDTRGGDLTDRVITTLTRIAPAA